MPLDGLVEHVDVDALDPAALGDRVVRARPTWKRRKVYASAGDARAVGQRAACAGAHARGHFAGKTVDVRANSGQGGKNEGVDDEVRPGWDVA